MKKASLLFAAVICVITLRAQVNENISSGTSKAVYAELLGSGLIFSANFDSRFKGSTGVGYRVGVGFYPSSKNSVITFPVGLNALIGKGSSHLEAEATVTLATSNTTFKDRSSAFFVYPHIGYRYTKPSNSILFRIYAGPLIFESKVLPWAGLSAGYTFK